MLAALIDNVMLLQSAFQFIDSCRWFRIGAMAQAYRLIGYSAELPGFARPGGIAMQDANSRGKADCVVLDALWPRSSMI